MNIHADTHDQRHWFDLFMLAVSVIYVIGVSVLALAVVDFPMPPAVPLLLSIFLLPVAVYWGRKLVGFGKFTFVYFVLTFSASVLSVDFPIFDFIEYGLFLIFLLWALFKKNQQVATMPFFSVIRNTAASFFSVLGVALCVVGTILLAIAPIYLIFFTTIDWWKVVLIDVFVMPIFYLILVLPFIGLAKVLDESGEYGSQWI